jgi:hypothetical protein
MTSQLAEGENMQYNQVFVSAEQTAQAHRILDALMAKQLVLGGPVVGGPEIPVELQGERRSRGLREHKLLTDEQDYN